MSADSPFDFELSSTVKADDTLSTLGINLAWRQPLSGTGSDMKTPSSDPQSRVGSESQSLTLDMSAGPNGISLIADQTSISMLAGPNGISMSIRDNTRPYQPTFMSAAFDAPSRPSALYNTPTDFNPSASDQYPVAPALVKSAAVGAVAAGLKALINSAGSSRNIQFGIAVGAGTMLWEFGKMGWDAYHGEKEA